MKRTKSGFTLVELLIVIVIIAILAAITAVAYNGIQARANDSKRKSDVAQIVKLLALYEVDNGPMYKESGCGGSGVSGNGDGSGWFNHENGTSYKKSVMHCLIDAGVTSTTIQDESTSCSGNGCHAYMKYTCTQHGDVVTYIYANLETGTHNGDETDGTCNGSADTGYGMNYFVRVD